MKHALLSLLPRIGVAFGAVSAGLVAHATIDWNIPTSVASGQTYSGNAHTTGSIPGTPNFTLYKSGAFYATGIGAVGFSSTDIGPKTVTWSVNVNYTSGQGYTVGAESSSRSVTIMAPPSNPQSIRFNSLAGRYIGQTAALVGSGLDQVYYRNAYVDLNNAFGSNVNAYWGHWQNNGFNEGRTPYAGSAGEGAACAQSGLPLTFSVVGGPATLSGNTVTLTGAGAVTLRATQAGGTAPNGAGFSAATKDIVVVGANRPSATISADAGTLYVGQSTTIRANFVSDAAHGDALGGTNIDAPLGTAVGANISQPLGSRTYTFTATALGTYTFYARMYTTLSGTWQTYATCTVTVANSAPATATLALSAETITYGQSLTATSTLSDPDGNLDGHSFWTIMPAANGGTNPVWDARTRYVSPNWTNSPINDAVWSGGVWYNGASSGSSNSTVSGVFTPDRWGIWLMNANGRDTAGVMGPSITRSITVNKAPLTITASSASKTYGTPNPGFTASYAGFVHGDTAAVVSGLTVSTTATTGSGAGAYPITASGVSAANYTPYYVAGTLTVSKAPLTITANSASRTYGAPNPGFTASYSGLVNADTPAVVSGLNLSTTATTGSAVGTYPITGSGASAANYTLAYAAGSLTVNRAPLTITANNASRVYGEPNPGFTASYAGLVNGDTPAVVSGLNLTTTATTGSGAGTYPITGSGASAANYTLSYATGTLTVSKATPAITWGAPAALTYGAPLSGTQLNATASVPGAFSYAPAAGTVLAAGAHTLTVTFTPTDTSNYNAASKTVTLTINKATPTLTWGPPAAITYGTALGGTQLNATASVAGSFSYAPAAGTVLAVGAHTLTATFTPTDTANYNATSKTVSLTVNQATPTLTWPAPAAIAYGTALSGTQLNATASVAGSFSYSPAAGTVLGAGVHTLTATFTPTDTASYQGTSKSVSLTVGQASATLTWLTPATITYGTPLGGAQLNAAAGIPGVFSYTPASGAVLSAGTQTLTVSFAPTDTANYAPSTAAVSLTVAPALLTITADDASKPAGAANPPFTATYSGFVAGDTAALVTGLNFSTTATAASPEGTYPITPSGASAANYSLHYQNGTLTVSALGQTVTLATGATSVTAGNRAPVSTPTLTVMTFVASGGSSGQYTWTLDGTVQSATAAEFTTSFSTAGPHTVSVMASADGFYAASLPAAFDVSVTAGNIWTVATGQGQVIALRSDGTVWAWGENGSGQLGDGTTTDRNAPVAVTGLTGVVAIAAGGAHSAAVKSDGTVWTWGENGSGQLGDGTVTTRLTPVQITGVTGVVALAAGTNHMLALKSDGTVWTWGGNASGQLGDGTTGSRPVAAAVSGLTNVKALAAGPDHSLAVKTDGTVWAWGKNEAGQTGDGTTANRVTPSQVPGFTGVIEVAAGASHSVALKSDGTVWAWGGNASGQLGDGTVTTRPSPVQVGGLSGMLAIGAGSNHSIAVKTDGSVVAWGKNAAGQLGDGTTTNRPSPGVVGGLASIVALAGHGAHTFAVATDGTVYSWGGDGFGSATIANLRLNQAAIRLTAAAGDADQDGMLDALENQYFGTTSRAGGADQDGDGLSDVQELYLGGDPTKADTDGDAVGDLDDPYPADYYDNAVPSIVVLAGDHQTGHAGQFNSQPFDLAIATNPGDELLVNAPVSLAVTGGGGSLATSNLATAALAPNLSLRTDAAGTVKVYYKQPVTDGISSQIEVTAGGAQLFLTTLSSTAADADGDGLLDAWELQHFGNTSPTGAEDADGDGLTNLVEMALGTDPTNPDSDNDGMNDGAEYTSGRNPLDRIDSVPLPAAYRLILRLPPSAYLGVKPDWTLDSVDAP